MAKSPDHKEILQSLSEGFDVLQVWWNNLSKVLPDRNLMADVAAYNSFDQKYFPSVNFGPISVGVFFLTLFQPHLENLFNDPADIVSLCIKPELRRYRMGLGYKLVLSPQYPEERPKALKSVVISTENGFDSLYKVGIRYNGRLKRNPLLETSIGLTADQHSIRHIRQVTKDGVFFKHPQSLPERQGLKQFWEFDYLYLPGFEPHYRFNYLSKEWKGTLGKLKPPLGDFVGSKSFLPNQEFQLTKAIIRACQFQPVIEL